MNPANPTASKPRRKYDNEIRRKKQDDLKSHIAAATAQLHAEKGAANTSYADIARLADVSLPTVYKHFPSEDDLFLGCTSHVAERAPRFPLEEILASANLVSAVRMLVEAMEQQHRYYEPWLVWRMEGYVIFVAEMTVQIRHHQSDLIEQILSHFLGPARRKTVIAGCETILNFDAWHRLVRGHQLARKDARKILAQSLLSIIKQGSDDSTDPIFEEIKA